MKRKLRSLSDIYNSTRPIQEQGAQPVELEEPLSLLLKDIEGPHLSPPPLHDEPNVIVPASPQADSVSSSDISSLNLILSPSTEGQVCKIQGRIEEEVTSIARDNGFTLDGEARHVWGQWVHGESTNLSTLNSILEDLEKQKEKSEWFESAVDVWSHQFLVPSPAEEFNMNPALVDVSFSLFLFLLLLVLLFLSFVTKRKKK